MRRTDKEYPPVIIVDENDNEVGSAMLDEVEAKELYHRVISVLVIDEKQRMLLQFRSHDVAVYKNLWDRAASGHVEVGCSYEQAAEKELSEEVGLHNLELTTLGTNLVNSRVGETTYHQFERVYLARVPSDVELKRGEEEVSKMRWFTPEELKALVAERPEKVTPGLIANLRKYQPKYIE